MKCVQRFFGENIYVRSKISYVRSSNDLCARAHAQSLEGTLAVAHFTKLLHKNVHCKGAALVNKQLPCLSLSLGVKLNNLEFTFKIIPLNASSSASSAAKMDSHV